jgi:DNA-binding LacI/PurR family transcriptional regulator
MKPGPGSSRLNMRTVALKAGVSSATVSRVINGSAAVKEETAEHVRRILDELKFIPNPIATTLKYGRSKTYGIIVPDLTNPFFPEFLVNFEEALIQNDHEMLLATTQSSESKLMKSVGRMLARHVDGVVLMASEYETRAIEPLFDHKIPIVTVDRRRVQEGTSDVGIDFDDGYRQAVLHLASLGHRRIGFIGGPEHIRTSQIRLKAFQKALEAAGLVYQPTLTAIGNYRVTGGEAAMRAILEAPKRPTAVVTVNDLSAFGALRALHSRGVRVPKEMSLIGFDGVQLGEAMYPPLTTIDVSMKDLVQACMRALDHLKTDVTKRGLRLNISASLLVRGSTGPAPRRAESR